MHVNYGVIITAISFAILALEYQSALCGVASFLAFINISKLK